MKTAWINMDYMDMDWKTVWIISALCFPHPGLPAFHECDPSRSELTQLPC